MIDSIVSHPKVLFHIQITPKVLEVHMGTNNSQPLSGSWACFKFVPKQHTRNYFPVLVTHVFRVHQTLSLGFIAPIMINSKSLVWVYNTLNHGQVTDTAFDVAISPHWKFLQIFTVPNTERARRREWVDVNVK